MVSNLAFGPSELYRTLWAFERSHAIFVSSKFQDTQEKPDTKEMTCEELNTKEEACEVPDIKDPGAKLPDTKGAEVKLPENQAWTEPVSHLVINHHAGKKTKYTYPEHEKAIASQTRGYHTCAEESRLQV